MSALPSTLIQFWATLLGHTPTRPSKSDFVKTESHEIPGDFQGNGRYGVGADTRSHESLSRTNHCGANNNKLYATIYPLQSVLWIVKNGYRSERQRKLSGVKDDLSLVASEVNTSGRLNGNEIRDTDWMRKCLKIGLVVLSYFNRHEIILNLIWK